FSDLFIPYLLSRNVRAQEDLVDQLFNSSEQRLARTLLLLANYGNEDTPETCRAHALLAILDPLLRSVWEKLSAVLPSSECRVALAERNHSVCLVSENASTLRQFLCEREFIARE